MSSLVGRTEFTDLGDLNQYLREQPSVAALLQAVYPSLSDAQHSELANYLRVYSVGGDIAVFREGEDGDFMVVLLDGLIQVSKGPPSDQLTLGFLNPGQTVGEMAIVDAKPRSATCTTVRRCALAVLTHESWLRLLRQQPALGVAVMQNMLVAMSARLRSANDSAAETYTHFLDV